MKFGKEKGNQQKYQKPLIVLRSGKELELQSNKGQTARISETLNSF